MYIEKIVEVFCSITVSTSEALKDYSDRRYIKINIIIIIIDYYTCESLLCCHCFQFDDITLKVL